MPTMGHIAFTDGGDTEVSTLGYRLLQMPAVHHEMLTNTATGFLLTYCIMQTRTE